MYERYKNVYEHIMLSKILHLKFFKVTILICKLSTHLRACRENLKAFTVLQHVHSTCDVSGDRSDRTLPNFNISLRRKMIILDTCLLKLTERSCSYNIPPFMYVWVTSSLWYSQESPTPYPEPEEFSPYPPF